MDKDIKKSISATDKDAQYDEKAKNLLGHKIILAHILVKTIDEFKGMNPKGMNPKDAVQYIEGEPYISRVPVDAGSTNVEKEQNGEKVIGLNTENSEINEGMIRFDIVFYVRMKDGLTQIIVNIEAQKEEPGKYYILNRAIFYIGRIVSSQKGRDFVKSEYNKMKRVYSIWICMNMKENSLTQIYLTKKNIIGSHDWKGDLELLNIIMIGIAENLPEKEENYELHRLLSALLSSSLEAEEKLDIIEKEYDIPIEDDIREEVEEMCNLSQGIKEKAFEGGYLMGQEEGRESGYAEGKQNGYAEAICMMYKSGLPIEQIAGIIKMSADKVNELVNPDLMD